MSCLANRGSRKTCVCVNYTAFKKLQAVFEYIFVVYIICIESIISVKLIISFDLKNVVKFIAISFARKHIRFLKNKSILLKVCIAFPFTYF